MDDLERAELLHDTAVHEAGHAVMRWLCGLPCGYLTAGEGDGFCNGTGKRISAEDSILILLSGLVAEVGLMVEWVNWERTRYVDLDQARQLLRASPLLRVIGEVNAETGEPRLRALDVDGALIHWAKIASSRLWPYAGLIEHLGEVLEAKRSLSARSAAAIIREWNRVYAREAGAGGAAPPALAERYGLGL